MIVHLIDKYYNGSLTDAVQQAMTRLEGSFAICAISSLDQGRILVFRKNSPLIIGVGENENYVSSDVTALIPHTKKVIYLEDMQIADISKSSIKIYDVDGNAVEYKLTEVDWSVEQSEKLGYDYFMQKEIFEQPKVIRDILNEYVCGNDIVFPNLSFKESDLKSISRFIIQACGTSWHAGLIGKYLIEDLARIPAEVDISSEFRYRRLLSSSNEIVVAISQSVKRLIRWHVFEKQKVNFLMYCHLLM